MKHAMTDQKASLSGVSALRTLIEQAVAGLFVNGFGQQAERLVLTSADGRDLGGWCQGAIVDRLLEALCVVQGERQEDTTQTRGEGESDHEQPLTAMDRWS